VPDHPVVVVSNRGPVSFTQGPDGELEPRRGAGGLVSGIGPVVAEAGATWIAAALSEGDRVAAGKGVLDAEGFRTRLLDIDAEDLRMAYDVVSNATLWFLHHGLWDRPRRPHLDLRWRQAWDGYRRFNRAFAEAVAAEAPQGATVLVQDYHLSLVGAQVTGMRPDLACVHFAHTPFASPDELRVLPDDVGAELVAGLAANRACGFHTARWADNFRRCCESEGVAAPTTFVSPLPADIDGLTGSAASAETTDELSLLDEQLGDRMLIARVDRIELSKNILRGFHAFEELLHAHPEWIERVVFGAFVYPSREGLPEYLAYRAEVEATARRINERWGTDGWQPVLLDSSDSFPRSVAALRRYDVLLVNPVRDGLNLVAKEGPLVNERDGVVVLSREAGAFDELRAATHDATVVGINPFDISATAAALNAALSMRPEARRARAARLVEVVRGRTARDWLSQQLAAAR
jgi:trehalose 6-phosphate synthase